MNRHSACKVYPQGWCHGQCKFYFYESGVVAVPGCDVTCSLSSAWMSLNSPSWWCAWQSRVHIRLAGWKHIFDSQHPKLLWMCHEWQWLSARHWCGSLCHVCVIVVSKFSLASATSWKKHEQHVGVHLIGCFLLMPFMLRWKAYSLAPPVTSMYGRAYCHRWACTCKVKIIATHV